MFFAHRENTMSSPGRLVLIIWLFVVLIITSSYTASLTSILTVQQLSSLDSLISSSEPIGYQRGSFAKYYLIEELNIPESRLRAFVRPEDYTYALLRGPSDGGVAAIIDELPYVEAFLSNKCKFRIVGHKLMKSGWGFAFPRDSLLEEDLSKAILTISQNGELQRIRDKWLTRVGCSSKADTNRLSLKSFWGLFLMCGIACVIALLSFCTKVWLQYNKYIPEDVEEQRPPNPISKRSIHTASIKNFIDFIDKKEDDVRKKIKRKRGDMKQQTVSPGSPNSNGLPPLIP